MRDPFIEEEATLAPDTPDTPDTDTRSSARIQPVEGMVDLERIVDLERMEGMVHTEEGATQVHVAVM